MIKPQAIRQIENKRFNKEFSTFPDLDSLKQFCKMLTLPILYRINKIIESMDYLPIQKEFMMSGSAIKIF